MRVSAVVSRALLAKLCITASTLFLVCSGQVYGQGQPFLDVGDPILGIDATILYSDSPDAEGPANAIDGNSGSKYLNFAKAGTGFIVTPGIAGAVESFQIRTANDAPGRDPASWELYGFTGLLTSTNDSKGDAEAWSLIGSGGVTLPGDPAVGNDQRGVLGPLVDVPTMAGFQHYKMLFPTLKDPSQGNVDSMQFAEIQLYSDNAGTSGLLAPGNAILGIACCDLIDTSSYPDPNERPALALDDNAGTKYLNFGDKLSGLIVTNAQGQSLLHTMRLTTANDAEGRDPASYELYGTNEDIQSLDNSQGLGGETWTLISQGGLSLPSGAGSRGLSADVVIGSTTPYESYKLIFPTLRDPNNSLMQIANVQFFAVPEPSTFLLTVILAAAGMVGIRRR